MKNLIYKEISKKLVSESGGNCEYDKGCIYGFGTKRCSASEKVVEEKFSLFKREWRDEEPYEKGACIGCSYDMAVWPCSEFKILSFYEPPRE